MKDKPRIWMDLGRTISSGLVMAMVVAGGGCSQESGNNAGEDSGGSSSGNPVTAPVDYLGAVGNAKTRSVKTTSLVGVEQAIKMFHVQEGRYPKDLNEIVGPDYLPRLPEVPSGMKFDYNPQTGEVKVVPQ